LSKTTPMQRTLQIIKSKKLKYCIVEVWNQWARRRIDLFNIIDILVLDGGFLGIQVCGTDYASHKKKIMVDEKENTMAWLNSGGRLEVWGWRQLKIKRGGKAKKWTPRISDVLIVSGNLCWEER